MFRNSIILTLGLLTSSVALADGHGHWGHHHGHHHHHGGYYPAYGGTFFYPPAPVVEYVPAPPVYYAPPPVVRYAPAYVAPAPVYYGGGGNGLVGGIVGGMAGYGLSGGDPLATGLGAAAGALIGNGSRY